jgi:hypothetical protein
VEWKSNLIEIYPTNTKISDDPEYFEKIVGKKDVKIVDLPNYGKSIIGGKDFAPGDVLYAEEAILTGNLRNDCCATCVKPCNMSLCLKCTHKGCNAVFCNKTCQERGTHRGICPSDLSELRNCCSKGVTGSCKGSLLAMDAIALLRSFPIGKPNELPFLKHLAISRMGSQLTGGWNRYLWVREVIDPFMERGFLEHDDFEILMSKIMNNCFGLSYDNDARPDISGSAAAIYLITSFINHSCVPNAKCVFSGSKGGSTVKVVALRKIKKGEQIFISYLPDDFDYIQRAYGLFQYGFICKCEKCVSDVKKLSESERVDLKFIEEMLGTICNNEKSE